MNFFKMSIFSTYPIYIKISRNEIEITDLKNATTVRKTASTVFSGRRNVVADFVETLNLIDELLKSLNLKGKIISPSLNVLIQQMEGFEGGLSDMEHLALNDLASISGAKYVVVMADKTILSEDEALRKLKDRNKNV